MQSVGYGGQSSHEDETFAAMNKNPTAQVRHPRAV